MTFVPFEEIKFFARFDWSSSFWGGIPNSSMMQDSWSPEKIHSDDDDDFDDGDDYDDNAGHLVPWENTVTLRGEEGEKMIKAIDHDFNNFHEEED